MNRDYNEVMMGIKVGRNDLCPCGSQKKYKHCCMLKGIDYETISHNNYIRNLTIRGKNKWFLNSVFEILDFNTNLQKVKTRDQFIINLKKTLTPENVRQIYEIIPILWPDKDDYYRCLETESFDESGLFIGNYRFDSTVSLLNKYGLYEESIVLIDPVLDHRRVAEKYNPIVHPEEHLVTTLHNLLLWLQLMPWIDNGVVKIIRNPCDFDYQLRKHSNIVSKTRYEESGLDKLIKEEAAKDEYQDRVKEFFKLSMPDDMILDICKKHKQDPQKMFEYIKQERLRSIDYVEGGREGQYLVTFSGTNYEIGKYLSSITGTHILTDLKTRWLEMEYDRKVNNIQSKDWECFSKHFQQLNMPYLQGLKLDDLLKLRKDGYLENMRQLLRKTWVTSCPDVSPEARVIESMQIDLDEAVNKAEDEWKKIDANLSKWFLPNIVSTGLTVLAGSPLWIPGASAIVTGGAAVIESSIKRAGFVKKYPASFFLNRR